MNDGRAGGWTVQLKVGCMLEYNGMEECMLG